MITIDFEPMVLWSSILAIYVLGVLLLPTVKIITNEIKRWKSKRGTDE